MRLQLDSSVLRPADSGQAIAPHTGPAAASRTQDSAGSGDSIGISGPSAALGRLSGERTVRIQQLTTAVRGDTYRIPAALVGKAILAQAAA